MKYIDCLGSAYAAGEIETDIQVFVDGIFGTQIIIQTAFRAYTHYDRIRVDIE